MKYSSKKIAMATRASQYKNNLFQIFFVDEKPIRSDMTFTIPFIVAGQFMISIIFRQRFFVNKIV